MPVTNYHTVNGRLIGETTAGVRTDYLTDALGSITATVNESAQIINTYRYKPFGERLAKTGSGADPRFQFTGDSGSVTTSRRYAENYNRRRSLDVKNGRWGSVDPVWPRQSAYGYVRANPTTTIDPSGLFPDFIECGDKKGSLAKCCHALTALQKQGTRDQVKKCMAQSGYAVPPFTNDNTLDYFLDLLTRLCTKDGESNRVCVRCAKGDTIPKWPDKCPNPCKEGYWAYTYPGDDAVWSAGFDKCGLESFPDYCPNGHRGNTGKCPCSIVMCESGLNNITQSRCAVLYHELAHCSQLGHIGGEPLPKSIKTDRPLDFIYKLACCVCLAVQGPGKCGEECGRVK